MKTAVAYIRISDDEQSHFSIDGQQRTISEYCERSSIGLVRSFVDNGFSAKNFNRPAWRELIGFLKSNRGKHSYLIVYKYDRMIRNTMEGLAMIQELEKNHKLTIISVCENLGLNPHSPYFKKVRADILVNAEFERDVISHRVRFGMNSATKAGRYLHQAPCGYVNSRDDQNKPILLIHPENSAIIETIFTTYAAGMNPKLILANAQAAGLNHVGHTVIRKILRNPLYCGLVRTTAFEGEPEKLVPGIHQPIVDQDLWWYVQSKLDQKSIPMAPKITSEKLPLRGLIRCMSGHFLTGCMCTGKSGRKWPYYKCNKCSQTHSAIKAHEDLHAVLTSISLDEDLQNQLLDRVRLKMDQKISTDVEKRKSAEKQISKTKMMIQSCEDKYLRDAISDETYQRQMKKLNDQLNFLQNQITGFKNETEFRPDDLLSVVSKLGRLSSIFSAANVLQKQQLLQTIFPAGLTRLKNAYQTPKINPILRYNAEEIKEKLIVGEPVNSDSPLSGPGGGRTHVQTRNFLVFYMLIL